MTSARKSVLSISQQQGQQALSAPQKKFNGLLQKIAAQRALLAAWQEAIPLFQRKRASTLDPLLASHRALSLELLRFLDQASDRKELGKTDRRLLHELICEMAADLMQGPEQDEVKAIYNRHSHSDYDTESKNVADAMKSMVEHTLGVDLGDDADIESPDDLMERLHRKMEAEQAQAAEHREQQRRKRKPTARQQRQQQEEQQASQSIREIFRKLASALHPDRETDPTERARKTEMMQRVNQAYAANNLLDLLQLQLEIEQINPQSLHTMGEERLLRFNRILTEQLSELQHEVLGTEHGFKMQFGIDPLDHVTPANMMRKLQEQTHWLQHDLHQLQRQRKALDDPRLLKRWIKEQHRQAREFDDGLPDDLLDLFQR